MNGCSTRLMATTTARPGLVREPTNFSTMGNAIGRLRKGHKAYGCRPFSTVCFLPINRIWMS